MSAIHGEDLQLFKQLLDENRFNYLALAYIIFPFGEKGHDLENYDLYDWQKEELRRMSQHFNDPKTRDTVFRLCVSSGNGAAKTALGAIVTICLMYTQRLRGRITANTKPQMTSVVWPEYDTWCQRARFFRELFEKLGESIKARDEEYSQTWRLDIATWSENNYAALSGLHNKGGAVLWTFEEAAGIPAQVWQYASGAFTETDTIKVWLAFANSDDPESKFEQCMSSPDWYSRRIDTRTLKHISKETVNAWLRDCGGNEDHDDFRVRVRGLPRKSSKDSIIMLEAVLAAIERGKDFDPASVGILPAILTVDPAWTGGDETTIWFHQGNYSRLLERYKLDKTKGDTHKVTYDKICYWEKQLRADAVLIDQGEGTTLKTLADIDGKYHWELVSFAGSPTDALEFKDSQFANIRAQMYYEAADHLGKGAAITARQVEWLDDVQKQLCWTKGGRHKTNLKKLAESKKDIKDRVGQSPDLADGFVLRHARLITERREENVIGAGGTKPSIGGGAYRMPDIGVDYNQGDVSGLYD